MSASVFCVLIPGCALGQTGFSHGAIDRLLDDGFVNVMSSLFACLCVFPIANTAL
jgi:hypothetical protein